TVWPVRRITAAISSAMAWKRLRRISVKIRSFFRVTVLFRLSDKVVSAIDANAEPGWHKRGSVVLLHDCGPAERRICAQPLSIKYRNAHGRSLKQDASIADQCGIALPGRYLNARLDCFSDHLHADIHDLHRRIGIHVPVDSMIARLEAGQYV